jgi:hypothetical protein
MIDYSFNANKSFSATAKSKKKAHCIADKIFVVIDESLMKCLSIDDETWFEQEVIAEGILLRICNKNKGIGEVC